jgi:hypothetical protein
MMGAALVTVISLFALPETNRRGIKTTRTTVKDPEPAPAVKG